jgi:recombination DNA repair RAD52 pathway protein
MSNKIIVSESELSLVENNALNAKQLSFLLKKTPEKYLRTRPAKGGGTWQYVSGGYVRKCLNLMLGWDWSFEIIEQLIMHGEAIVKGKLTCNVNGRVIIKTQFGNKDIMYRKALDEQGNKVPLSIGNDLKAAATDCLKKCAAELGIAADVYSADEFREIDVVSNEDTEMDLLDLFELKKESLSPAQLADAERIINNKETNSYSKLLKTLQTA